MEGKKTKAAHMPFSLLPPLQRHSSSTITCCLHRCGPWTIVRRLPHILCLPISNCFPVGDTASPVSTPNKKNCLTNCLCKSFASLIGVGKKILLLKKCIRPTLFSLLCKTRVLIEDYISIFSNYITLGVYLSNANNFLTRKVRNYRFSLCPLRFYFNNV